MMTLLLFIITISSFLFYGVVGEDKTWLLAPGFTLTFAWVSIALVRKAFDFRRSVLASESLKPLPIAHGLWAMVLLYGIALIPQAVVPFEAKLELLFVGGVVGAYLVWGSELTTFRDNRVLLGALIFVVMLCALYGLVIHFKCPEKVLWAERYSEGYVGRLRSTYICPNHFAHLMQMLLPFCLVLLFIPQAGAYLKILAGYSFLVFLPPLYLTESRAGWLGSIAAVGVTLCLMALRRSKKLFGLLVVLVPLCSILLLFAGWRYSETFQRRAKPVVAFLQQQSDEGVGSESRDFRPQTWMDTIDMIKEAPLFGFGPGNYRYTFPEYRKRFKGQRIVTGHPHNEYLELIADYGLIGFGLFALAWMYGLIWIGVQSLKATETRHALMGLAFVGMALGTMVHSFFDFQLHIYPNALVFALLAVVAGGPLLSNQTRGRRTSSRSQKSAALSARDTEANTRKPPPQRLRRWVYILFACGYVVGTAFCIQVMSSAFIRALGDKATEVRNIPRAERYYALAVKIDPQNWRAYKGLAKLGSQARYYTLDRDEKLRLALAEEQWYEKAYEQNSHDPVIVEGFGKVLFFIGQRYKALGLEPGAGAVQTERSLALLREACSYRKFNDLYWWTLGVKLRDAEQYEEALEVFRYTEKIKRSASTRKNIQWIEARLRGDSGQQSDVGDPKPVSESQRPNLRLQREKTDLSDVLNLMEN